MRFIPAKVVALLAPVALAAGMMGCTGPRGVAGASGVGCTITAADGGAKQITCADGTSVTVQNGQPGASCTIGVADGGAKTITCTDGTSVVVHDGDAGTSCTVGTADGGIKVVSCTDGTSVPVSPDPPPPPNVLGPADDLPGVVVHIVSVTGGSGSGGNFEIGDTMKLTFTLATSNGGALPLSAMDQVATWIAGPTSGYQRVLPVGRDQFDYSDVMARAVRNGDGSYTYTFPAPLPAAYGPPLFDTTKFTAGELTGQPLQHGTYTLALRAFRTYTIGTVTYPDVGSQTQDFLLGTATALEPREVVTLGNCNQCHTTLQAHGGTFRDTKLCVTCHTAGAEDANSTDTGDATPVTIQLSTMIHKIHNGAHLPSVLGVGTNADGTRNYTTTPVPYRVTGFGGAVNDFSDVQFPVWPSLSFPTPRNLGYSTLTTALQATDDQTRMGVIACERCHGDADGAGPLAAPAQGSFAFSHPSRQVCGSCHDDIDWTKTYKRNTATGMPAQADDSNCLVCHPASGFAVGGSPVGGHLHPMNDPTFNPGLVVALSALHEAGTNNGNGKLDVGEKIGVTINVTDGSGTALPAASIPALSVVVTGPTTNRNLLLSSTIPVAALATLPVSLNLPDVVNLELLGTSSATTGDIFTVARTPIWNVTGALPTIFVRTGTGVATTLTAAAPALQNNVTVASSTGLLRNDYVVIDDGVAGTQEYLRVQWVDGNRLWFAAAGAAGYQPGLRVAHNAGATLTKVTLATKVAGTDYTVAPATGAITEVTELGAGAAVLATYTTDFVMPAVYGPPLNDSPDLGPANGKWKGLPLVAGTYTVGVWGSRTLTLSQNGESNSYRSTSLPANVDFLVGTATTLAPVAIVSPSTTCVKCHADVLAHGGGRRGVDTCLLCHGSAGTEDRPQYVAAAAPATPGAIVEFRSMLHKIHRGANPDLTNAAMPFSVVGFGAGAYPNTFSVLTFAEDEFPAMPSGVKNCAACHGTSTAWQTPADRSHPTAAVAPAQSWGVACSGCHDTSAALAHFDIMTSSLGNESCSVCHDAGRDQAVALMHKVR